MRVYLVQHGEAHSEEVSPERELTPRGRSDVERIAALLANGSVQVAKVYHSGKTRARQTAELLAARLAPGVTSEALAGINPNDPVESLRGTPGVALEVNRNPLPAARLGRNATGGPGEESCTMIGERHCASALQRAQHEKLSMQLDRSTTTCISVNSRATNSKSRSKGTGSNSRVSKTPRNSSYRLSGILSLTSKGYGDRYGRTRRGGSNNNRSY